MKRHDFLLPYRTKCVGWVILGIGVLLWGAWLIGNGEWDFSINSIRSLLGITTIEADSMASFLAFSPNTGLMGTVTSVLIILGTYLSGFSRCKEEDEFTQYLRYRALTVTVLGLMTLDLVVVLFCWGLNFLIIRNILVKLSPIFYVFYFHFLSWRERRRNEE